MTSYCTCSSDKSVCNISVSTITRDFLLKFLPKDVFNWVVDTLALNLQVEWYIGTGTIALTERQQLLEWLELKS